MRAPPATPAADDLYGLYGGFSPHLKALALQGVVHHFPKKALLIREGDEGDSLFVLLKGLVKVFSVDQNRRELTFSRMQAGEYFGELSLDGGTRWASVMALEPCTCAVVPCAALKQYLADEPVFALELVSQVVRRARAATEAARNLALRDVYSRLVEALETESLLDAKLEPEASISYPLNLHPVTHQDIASRIGASREMISRLLKDLEKGGYVETSTKRIVLLKKLPARW